MSVCVFLQEVACEQQRITPILFLLTKLSLTSVWDSTCIKEQHNRAFMGRVTLLSPTLYKSPRTTKRPAGLHAENLMPRCQLAQTKWRKLRQLLVELRRVRGKMKSSRSFSTNPSNRTEQRCCFMLTWNKRYSNYLLIMISNHLN